MEMKAGMKYETEIVVHECLRTITIHSFRQLNYLQFFQHRA